MRKIQGTMLKALCLALLLAWACPALAAQKEAKEAIVLVAFGTSVQQAQASYDTVEKQVRAAFPGKEIRWAWTATGTARRAARATMQLTLVRSSAVNGATAVRNTTRSAAAGRPWRR